MIIIKYIAISLFLHTALSSIIFAVNSEITLKGVGISDSSSHLKVTANGTDTAYLFLDSIYVQNGASLTTWGPAALGGTKIAGDGDITVPVELTSFAAELIGGSVNLNWRTETESDNFGFNILRSPAEKGSYIILNNSIIKGAGNSASPRLYSFKDTDAISGNNYYKLEMISVTGEKTYSGLIYINNVGPTSLVGGSTNQRNHNISFTNPTENIIISLEVNEPIKMSVTLYAENGNILGILIDRYVTINEHLTFNQKLEPGVYFIKIQSKHYYQIEKILINK